MSHATKIVNDRYVQGQAAYRAGHHIKDLMHISDELERLHDDPSLTNEQHSDIAASAQSLVIGFADALIDDIRTIARGRANQRA